MVVEDQAKCQSCEHGERYHCEDGCEAHNRCECAGYWAADAGWSQQQLSLPLIWYVQVNHGSGAEYPISGDRTLINVGLEMFGLPFLHESA